MPSLCEACNRPKIKNAKDLSCLDGEMNEVRYKGIKRWCRQVKQK